MSSTSPKLSGILLAILNKAKKILNPQPNVADSETLNQGDGVDHIRIDLRSKTELGQLLDSQKLSQSFQVIHNGTDYGTFCTTEGFWYFISTDNKDEELIQILRTQNGHSCRKAINKLREQNNLERVHLDNFHELIEAATLAKCRASDRLRQLMIESNLPFKYYYINKKGEVVYRRDSDWLVNMLDRVRQTLRNES